MLPQYRFADAQPEAGASPRPLGGIERIEDVRQHLGSDSRTVILERDRNGSFCRFQANPQGATLAGLAHRLLGIQDEVEENLHELVGIAVDYG